MSIKGSPYPRFKRALRTGNLNVIRAAAAEVRSVDLGDALTVCMAIRDQEPDRFERASLRWLARFCVERARTAQEVREAAAAFTTMAADPAGALDALRRLAEPGR